MIGTQIGSQRRGLLGLRCPEAAKEGGVPIPEEHEARNGGEGLRLFTPEELLRDPRSPLPPREEFVVDTMVVGWLLSDRPHELQTVYRGPHL